MSWRRSRPVLTRSQVALAGRRRRVRSPTGRVSSTAASASSPARSQLDSGAGQLRDGAGQLADGLGEAADGSGKIAEGLGKAADGAPKLEDGAQRLSDEGTKKLVEAGKSTAADYGQKYALIEAGAQRAKTEGMAYGAPADAAGTTAYSFELAGMSGEGGRNMGRTAGAAAIFGLAGAAAPCADGSSSRLTRLRGAAEWPPRTAPVRCGCAALRHRLARSGGGAVPNGPRLMARSDDGPRHESPPSGSRGQQWAAERDVPGGDPGPRRHAQPVPGPGPPMLFLPGLTPTHAAPHGFARRFALHQMRPFADRRQVVVGRRRGLTAHTTMADIADDYATALQPGRRSPRRPRRLDRWQRCPAAGRRPPAPRPAARPGLIRLPARSARAGRPAPGPGGARVASAPRGRRHAHASGGGRAVRGDALAALGWLAPRMVVGEATDLRATIRAEDGFDVTSRLATIQAPTLVVGGDRDAFYGEEVFRETARLLPRASCCCTGARGTWACEGPPPRPRRQRLPRLTGAAVPA